MARRRRLECCVSLLLSRSSALGVCRIKRETTSIASRATSLDSCTASKGWPVVALRTDRLPVEEQEERGKDWEVLRRDCQQAGWGSRRSESTLVVVAEAGEEGGSRKGSDSVGSVVQEEREQPDKETALTAGTRGRMGRGKCWPKEEAGRPSAAEVQAEKGGKATGALRTAKAEQEQAAGERSSRLTESCRES